MWAAHLREETPPDGGDGAAGRGPPPPETCGDAITTMAVPGGDLNRRGDGPPGHEVTWRGYAQPATMADTY